MDNADSLKHWYVMRDFKKYNAKSPAYKELPKLGVRCFTPMHDVVITDRNGKRQRIRRPVIQNLLFVYGNREVLDPIVAQTDKLQYQFKRGAGPHALMFISDSEMDRFIKAVSSDNSPVYYKPEELTPDMIGRQVVINGGPLDGYEGKLLKMQGSKRRRLLVKIEGLLAAGVEVQPEYIKLL